jgi:nucleoside-diphosphate-sugar epimerase
MIGLNWSGNMKITILGSSGQIGKYLTEYLKNKGYQIYEFDKINGSDENMSIIPNPLLEERIANSDFVFFLAFDVGGSRYLKKYQHEFQFIDNNTRLMANAFGFLKKYNKRFIFASSQMSNMSYSPYGVLKNIGELYTKSLNGLIVKFWNVYGIEKDYEKAHVITDFIKKGFETGIIDMLTDGEEEREFLYAEDCCEALEIVMENYNNFTSEDNLHITSFDSTKIKDIANIIVDRFNLIGMNDVKICPSEQKDTVQMDKRNTPDAYITEWWMPKTSIENGISKVFDEMKNDWI